MKIIMIRHGKTPGNLEKRYIGATDEPLSEAGRRELLERRYPPAKAVVASPMKRCLVTAALIYPEVAPAVYEGLRECDFGRFEGKNYQELQNDRAYRQWVESNGTLPFPGGESRGDFVRRSVEAFLQAASDYRDCQTVAFVVHGGTIMAVLERLAFPRKPFYDWQVPCGCGFVTEYDGKIMKIESRIQ